MSIGNFLESLSQQILVRIILVGRLGVNPPSDAPEPGQLRVGLEPILQRPGAGRRLRHPRRSGAERALVWYVCVCVCMSPPRNCALTVCCATAEDAVAVTLISRALVRKSA